MHENHMVELIDTYLHKVYETYTKQLNLVVDACLYSSTHDFKSVHTHIRAVQVSDKKTGLILASKRRVYE
jgi:hypothetical protein